VAAAHLTVVAELVEVNGYEVFAAALNIRQLITIRLIWEADQEAATLREARGRRVH
jgi:hypothetical protein